MMDSFTLLRSTGNVPLGKNRSEYHLCNIINNTCSTVSRCSYQVLWDTFSQIQSWVALFPRLLHSDAFSEIRYIFLCLSIHIQGFLDPPAACLSPWGHEQPCGDLQGLLVLIPRMSLCSSGSPGSSQLALSFIASQKES